MPDPGDNEHASSPSTDSQWSRVQHWFHEALEQPTELRETFLRAALEKEPRLLGEVRSLLAALDAGEERFGAPLIDLTAVGETQLMPGSDIGMWTILRKIGEGGMATVYEAIRRDADMPKRAALKTVRAISSLNLRARFARERRILAALEHPNIAALLDGGTLPDGRPWLAMEYVEGQRIDQWCATRKLDVRARVRLLLQVCRAVDAAHQRSVVHRDLKPTNIFVTNDGTVKLLDFGIAKLAEDTDRTETVTGGLMMTADYASPEQLRGDPITVRSDIYSLGVVAFELLSGARPFAMRGQGLRDLMRLADTAAPRLTQVVSELSARDAGLPPGDKLRSTVRGDLESIVAKALQKDAGTRYASAREVADDLVAWLESRPVSAHAPSVRYRIGRLVQRNRRSIVATSALAVVSIVTALWIGWQEKRNRIEQERAASRLDEVRTLVRTLVYDVNDRLADMPGSTRLRANVVRTALQSLDRASSNAPRDPQLQRELAMAYQRAGDVLGNPTQNNLGDAAGALDAYRKGLDLTEQMLHDEPRSVGARWTKALALEKIADVEAPSGNVDAALAHQRQSLALFREIANEDSANPEFLRAVGISALKLGDLLGHPAFTNKGETDSAIVAYRVGAERLDAAARRGDTTFFVRRHQAVVQERLGRLMHERQDYANARTWLQRSLDLRLSLERESPRSVQARRDVAIAYYLLCGLHLDEGAMPFAIDRCNRSLEIRRVLLAEDPNNNVLVRGMGIMHRRLAAVHVAARDTAAALREFNDAIRYYRRYLDGRAGALNDRKDYAYLLLEHVEIAAPSAQARLRAEARVNYEAARASLDSIGAIVPLVQDDSLRLQRVASLFRQ